MAYGPIHPRVVGAAWGAGRPGRGGVCKKQFGQLVAIGLRLAGCVTQPPDPVVAEELGDGHLPACPVTSSSSAVEGPPMPVERCLSGLYIWYYSCIVNKCTLPL